MTHTAHTSKPNDKGTQRRRPASVASVAACVLLTVCIYTSPASAADASNRQQAIDIALQQNGGEGKVLGVSTDTDKNGSTVFSVKVLANGRVRIIRVKKAE